MRDSFNLPLTVYKPESQIRNPTVLLRLMFKNLLASRELAWRLFIRDVTAQYRQSILGIFWSFLPPIVTSLVFILLQSRNIINFGETDIPYPIYVITGNFLWQIFIESLNGPLKSLQAAKPMLVKINFTYEALVLSAIYNVIFSAIIKFAVLLLILLVFKVEIYWSFIFVPVSTLMLIMFGITIGLFLSPFGILYTDISSSLPIVTQLWYFVTPVIYPVPNTFPFVLISVLNPVSPLIIGTRNLITIGVLTNPLPYIIVTGMTYLLLLIAWVIYRLAMPIIIERISA